MHKMSYHLDHASQVFSGLWQESFWQIASPLTGIMQKKRTFPSSFQLSILRDVLYLIPDLAFHGFSLFSISRFYVMPSLSKIQN